MFRIPNQDQSAGTLIRRASRFVPDLSKDIVLDRIRVLKFVDQGKAITSPKELPQLLAALAFEPATQLAPSFPPTPDLP